MEVAGSDTGAAAADAASEAAAAGAQAGAVSDAESADNVAATATDEGDGSAMTAG